MDHEQLDALFALLKAFPQERHWVDMHGTLVFHIPLTDEQHAFWKGAVKMMAPLDDPVDS